MNPLCFVAGTLVHTRNGLKAIEQVATGDLVLSKPESGEGGPEYRRVSRTFVRTAEELWLIEYWIEGEMLTRSLVATRHHPFWTLARGWTIVGNLGGGAELLRHDHAEGSDRAVVFRVQRILETGVPAVGWAGGDRDTDGLDRERGPVVDLRRGQVRVTQPDEDVWNQHAVERSQPLSRPVFDLEVDEFCTYFVGEAGIWVRGVDTSPKGRTQKA